MSAHLACHLYFFNRNTKKRYGSRTTTKRLKNGVHRDIVKVTQHSQSDGAVIGVVIGGGIRVCIRIGVGVSINIIVDFRVSSGIGISIDVGIIIGVSTIVGASVGTC